MKLIHAALLLFAGIKITKGNDAEIVDLESETGKITVEF
jgi:hypothetical protein